MAEVVNKANPFPGLKHYEMNNSHLFFGREEESEEVLKKLLRHRFVSIIGATGSGKSSLMHAGILPVLSKGLRTSQGSKWRFIYLRPGISPVDNIARALVKSELSYEQEDSEEIRYNIKIALLRNSSRGLVESLRQLKSEGKENILIVIDNFEEIFHVSRNRIDRNTYEDYEAFVKLLAEAKREENLPVYIVVSMRHDYLPDSLQFPDLTGLLNESGYFIPKMKEQALLDVINGPVRAKGAEMDPRLVRILLSEAADQPFKLPFLQYVLMRMWDCRIKQEDSDLTLTVEDYEAVGEMNGALAKVADEAFEELSDNGKLICERMFKILAEKQSNNRLVANPTRVSDIAFITRTSVSDVIDIIERFRRPGRAFIEPQHNGSLNSDTVADLSHESFIEMWPRLRQWVDEESASIDMYKYLSERSKMYQVGKAGLLTTPRLQMALKWRDKNQPTFEWAQRFDKSFERTMTFLAKSEDVFKAEEEDKVLRPRKLLRKTQIVAFSVALAAVILGVLTFHFMGQYTEADERLRVAEQWIKETESGLGDIMAEFPVEQKEEPDEGRAVSRDEAVAAPARALPERSAQAPVDESYEIREAEAETAAAQPPSPDLLIRDDETDKTEDVDIAGREAYARRMVEIAQAMAVKSLQEERDKDLKGLLASLAYKFNRNYGGRELHSDIYLAMYASVKRLQGDTYNIYSGHNESVNSVVFSPTGDLFYSTSSDGRILQWNPNDENKTSRTLLDHSVINNSLAISPNGQWLACATDGRGIQVINPSRYNPVPFQISWADNRIVAIEFSSDNEHIIFAGSDNSIVKWNIRTREYKVVASIESEILSLSVSPQGKYIAAGTRAGEVILLDGQTEKAPLAIFKEGDDAVYSVSFNVDGTKVMAGSLRGKLTFWDISSGDSIVSLNAHSARVVDIRFSPDNRTLASTSFDGTVKLWNVQNFSLPPLVLTEHESWVNTVAFNSTGEKMVTGSRNGKRLILWPVRPGSMMPLICSALTRSFTKDEWDIYVGEDIPMTDPCQ